MLRFHVYRTTSLMLCSLFDLFISVLSIAVFTRSESHSSFIRFMLGNDSIKADEVGEQGCVVHCFVCEHEQLL
jgi:hypothetical protein